MAFGGKGNKGPEAGRGADLKVLGIRSKVG